jgi:hypothetical protein
MLWLRGNHLGPSGGIARGPAAGFIGQGHARD